MEKPLRVFASFFFPFQVMCC